MNGTGRLAVRLVLHLFYGLLLLSAFICMAILISTEWLYPDSSAKQDSSIFIGFGVAVAVFLMVFGWWIGRPLYYLIGWLRELAEGREGLPSRHAKMYKLTGEDYTLRRSLRLYRELFLQMQLLSDALNRTRVERARLDEMRRDWIAGISHDLKTPLTYVKGYSSILLASEYEWKREEQSKFLGEIRQKAAHMEQLIEDLNVSFRLDEDGLPLERTRCNMTELIRRLLADAANDPRAEGFSFSMEGGEREMYASVDEKLMRRALHNLLINAVVHNPSGTSIAVAVTALSPDCVVIEISDDGTGMDKQTVEQLFQKYYRGTTTESKSDGSGLGMAIARGLIMAHGGDVGAVSRMNEGTTITITLPR